MEDATEAFNLSILECKSGFFSGVWQGIQLLISPYWNVNMRTTNRPLTRGSAFNLSILECKFKLYCKAQFGYDDF